MKFKIIPIAGDASFRTFYRISSKKKSTILVYTQKENYKNLTAYSAINKFLREKKILTPKTYLFDFSKGVMIIEDFGDLSFNKVIAKNKNKLKIYKKLVDLLIKIQKINPKSKIKNIHKGFYKIDKYSNKLICFNALHGTFGEDGSIQKILNKKNFKYTHSSISSSKNCFNKSISKNK